MNIFFFLPFLTIFIVFRLWRVILKRIAVISVVLFAIANPSFAQTTYATNIQEFQNFAWSETSGWFNFRPAEGGVTVYADHLEGFAWSTNIGWIKLGSHNAGGVHTYENTDSTNWGVNNDLNGNLSGYAWSETTGWINFDPDQGGVTIDGKTGKFSGYAWSTNIGWIHFADETNEPPLYGVQQDIHDLRMAISSLQILSGQIPEAYRNYDINADQKIGIEETIFVLQNAAELREDAEGPLP